ncbi:MULTISPECIES: hypothetical protein [unclassified Nodularia (in: cyanobacteria)]|uniref:hypothetical protein n=1 Tax=unclassified Nodularia (in: cyanobacteria) TaxID=2656917 RepID=UPI001D10010A|nr:hypothetical protein [Nodularia sp. LEGE 04288]MCC2692490.1 hypothetical protein [Nodularia sp. LEGE 04288]
MTYSTVPGLVGIVDEQRSHLPPEKIRCDRLRHSALSHRSIKSGNFIDFCHIETIIKNVRQFK